MPIEIRSSSAPFRRAEQLKRWVDSETNRESSEVPSEKKFKIQFSDGCVFLAACAAGEIQEVERLLEQDADINTANVDGLTALHQACIDDNLEMVQFLVEHGCNVNEGDNEGWTPLHATASCGFVSIAIYLLENGANVAAVNNDGDLPIDIAESKKMKELLSDALDEQGIDCDEARIEEEKIMLEDAKQWSLNKNYEDSIHPKTGASALHVAAAKGYTDVMEVLIGAGADLNMQDNDGWTPLHAAAHWAQKEACAMLADNLANMDIQNFSGQTCFDVAEPELVTLLEELKKKQVSMQKDRPEIQAILKRTSDKPPLKRRTSVTRMSNQEKSKSVMKDTKSERAQIQQLTLPEEDAEDDKERKQNENNQKLLALKQELKKLGEGVPQKNIEIMQEKPKDAPAVEKIPSWKKMLRRSSENLTEDSRTVNDTEVEAKKSKKEDIEDTSNKNLSSCVPTNEVTSNTDVTSEVLKHSELADSNVSPTSDISPDSQLQGKRAFIPPARDDESELQRKAHAKRVRETRRSTQGVLLEDVKSAELQYIIKKTQSSAKEEEREQHDEKENDDFKSGTSLKGSQLVSEDRLHKSDEPLNDEKENTDTCEMPPSSRTSDSVSETVEATLSNKSSEPSSPDSSPSVTLVLRPKLGNSAEEQLSPDSRTALATQAAIQRRRRPKRRSTGVVYLDSDDAVEEKDISDKEKNKIVEDKAPQNEDLSSSDRGRLKYGSSYPEASSRSSSLASSKGSLNEEKDYKKLYEDLKKENEQLHELEKDNDRLRKTLKQTEEELDLVKMQLKKYTESNSTKNTISDSEKKERRALERKLSEMEEEVKQMEKLRADNKRLRDENGALIRVISKISK